MYGNTVTRSARAIFAMARNPRHGALWIRDRVSGRPALSLGVPWTSWAAVEYLGRLLRPGMRVLEWGGGGSTIWFASAGCSVVTIESSPEWADRIQLEVANRGLLPNVEMRVIPCESGDSVQMSRYARAVREGGPWDLVLVDGWEHPNMTRMDCFREAIEFVADAGTLVLDDSWRAAYSAAPVIAAAYERIIFRGLGPARWGVTSTDVYRRRS